MEVNGGNYPNANGSPATPGTFFTGPLLAGTVPNTTTSTLAGVGGTNGVANVGYAVMAQSSVVTQAGGSTEIVVPAQSQILAIYLMVTTAWTGTTKTMGIGSTASATAFTTATAVNGAALGQVSASPGTNATAIGNWDNVGNTDVKLAVTSVNTGSGVGTLTVVYLQGINNAS